MESMCTTVVALRPADCRGPGTLQQRTLNDPVRVPAGDPTQCSRRRRPGPRRPLLPRSRPLILKTSAACQFMPASPAAGSPVSGSVVEVGCESWLRGLIFFVCAILVIAGKQARRSPSSRLVIEIDIGEPNRILRRTRYSRTPSRSCRPDGARREEQPGCRQAPRRGAGERTAGTRGSRMLPVIRITTPSN